MSRQQRLTFLGVAAAIAIVAVIVLVAAGGGGGDDSASAATSQPGPLLTSGKTPTLKATEGDTVYLRVKAPDDDEVHIHGYDIEKELKAGETVPISFKATITGRFEIEFHHAETQIGELEVEPK